MLGLHSTDLHIPATCIELSTYVVLAVRFSTHSEPGVGKTAVAEGLAQRIVTGDVPTALQVRHSETFPIWSLQTHSVFDSCSPWKVTSVRGEHPYSGEVTASYLKSPGTFFAVGELNVDCHLPNHAISNLWDKWSSVVSM